VAECHPGATGGQACAAPGAACPTGARGAPAMT
jgi:hypothetical protein